MKKRIVSLLIAVIMMITMSACSAAPQSTANAAQEPATVPEYAQTEDAGLGTQAPTAESDWVAHDTEQYLDIQENTAQSVQENSTLTFSLKVDTASYTNVKRYIEDWQTPPVNAVRIEEMVNYFSYEETVAFSRDCPFGIYTEVAPSPFDENKQLAFVRVKTKEIDTSDLPASNFVFLIDTSGSMNSYDKLPLLKQAFSMLVDTLDKYDRVSIITYAGSSEIVLEGARGDEKQKILNAINTLTASGSTAGANGIMTAYELAEQHFLEDGNNRVILATDGDFNVGPSSTQALADLVAEQRGNGVYLSILGFGTGNLRDDIMETLSKEGNGNYSYITDLTSAQKVLIEELSAHLFTVADDVKAQVEFNPQNVSDYRLIGYENRQLNNRDFNDDTKDAGEIGAGTDVVMLFELTLTDDVDGVESKYETETQNQYADELFEVRIRYKAPGESESQLTKYPVKVEDMVSQGSTDFTFAASVAGFGQILRNSEYAGEITLTDIYSMAEDSLGKDKNGYRQNYLTLLENYGEMTNIIYCE